MSYAPPRIGLAGLTIPSFRDILNFYLTNYQSIYGQNVSLDNSNADIQLINVIALTASDVMNALQLEYSNRAPSFAIGAAQDALYKNNGLARLIPTFSTCLVTLTGTAGAKVTNGIAGDVNGNLWNLPTSVTIGSGGTVTVLATAQVAGAISVSANQITSIKTPTAGWTSVTNGTNLPTVGAPVESDSKFRARQAVSTELPSITLPAGTLAGIEATPGVTRAYLEENPTGATDANGCPPHSITAVVEGGTNLAVATAIYNNRGLGVLTNSVVTSPVTAVVQAVIDATTGVSFNVSFNRPLYEPVYVIVNAHLLAGGTSATLTAIQTAVVSYLNSLRIGERVSYGALISAAMSVNSNLSQPVVSVVSLFFALTPTPTTITDIILTFNEVAQGVTGNVTVNSV
jgi:hypothetical protein